MLLCAGQSQFLPVVQASCHDLHLLWIFYFSQSIINSCVNIRQDGFSSLSLSHPEECENYVE